MGRFKPIVKSSVSIEVRPPEGFSITGGDKEIKPKEVSEEEEIGKVISDLVDVLSTYTEQADKLRNIIGKLKKIYPCKDCGKV
jgi:hypothetical protein